MSNAIGGMPAISIIVPVYNVEQYLSECVESILNQTFKDYECILVDDGSLDGGAAICDRYARKDERVLVIHQENEGVSAARNAGLHVACGKYVAFIDSDDFVSKDYLKTLYEVAEDTKADMIMCGVCSVVEGGQKNTNSIHVAKTEMCGKDVLHLRYSEGGVNIAAWGKLVLRTLFNGVYFPVGKIHEDQAVMPFIIYKADKVCIINEQLYFYRQRAGSITHRQFSESRFDNIEFMNKFITYLEKHNDTKLAFEAKRYRDYSLALYKVWAKVDGFEIPPKWYMNELKALRILKKRCTNEKYTYYLSVLHPNWVKYHEYIKKIESVFVRKK